MKQKLFFLTLAAFCLLMPSTIRAQQQQNVQTSSADLSELSKTANGRRVLDFFAAFNSGDKEKFKNFFLENLPAKSPD